MIGLIDTLQSGNNRPNEVAERGGILGVRAGMFARRLGLQNNFAALGRLSCSVSSQNGRVVTIGPATARATAERVPHNFKEGAA